MTPADTLRGAATRLREAADGATPNRWDAEGFGVLAEPPVDSGRRFRVRVARLGWEEWETDKANAAYIALVDPVVGAKLADLLEEAAEHLEVDLRDPDIDVCGTAVEGLDCSLLSGALSLARSILGEEAEGDG